MKIKHITSEKDLVKGQPTVLVLGYFDGLHLGHKALFDAARALADKNGWTVTVLTFPETPKLAFARYHPELLLHLTSPEERHQMMAAYGVDILYLIDFTHAFSTLSAQAFITHYVEGVNAQAVVAGFDYKFGRDHKQSSDLDQLYQGQVIIIPEVQQGQEKISSTAIREAVKTGQVKRASQLLGRPYTTTGLVVHGDARGRTIGYPTANLAPLHRTHLPTDGVYVVEVDVAGQRYRGMASVGKNVTFDGTEPRLEVNIFDFNQEIYGQTLKIFWLDKLREMVKFDGIEALLIQLKQDEIQAKNLIF